MSSKGVCCPMTSRDDAYALPEIPVLETGTDFPLATLEAFGGRAQDLFDQATRHVPDVVLRVLDQPSRAWLVRHGNPHLAEIDAVAKKLDRPGAYFLSTNYEWGCTCRLAKAGDGGSVRLIRVLDWRTPGLGRNLVAAKVAAPAGLFVTLTWPGYTGVLSAMAPGRFSAALNQAPMRRPTGLFPLDWLGNRRRAWRMAYRPPAMLLREVFEQAADFDEAKAMLSSERIAAPAIFLIAGTRPDERVIIERSERHARVHEDGQIAANHWQASDWHGSPRGIDSAGRARLMERASVDFDGAFSWLTPPILNQRTRLAMVADAGSGLLVARGFEAMRAATQVLKIDAKA